MAIIPRLYLKKGSGIEFDDKQNLIGQNMNSSEFVVKAVRPMIIDEVVEHCYCFFLDSNMRVAEYMEVGQGSFNATPSNQRVLFAAALLGGFKDIILIHNHPSGRCIPSKADIQTAKAHALAARLLQMQLVDDIILTNDAHVSMREFGFLPSLFELDKELDKLLK